MTAVYSQVVNRFADPAVADAAVDDRGHGLACVASALEPAHDAALTSAHEQANATP